LHVGNDLRHNVLKIVMCIEHGEGVGNILEFQ